MFFELIFELVADLSLVVVEGTVNKANSRFFWLRYGLACLIFLLHLTFLAVLFFVTVIGIKALVTDQKRAGAAAITVIMMLVIWFWGYRCWKLAKLMWQATKLMARRER